METLTITISAETADAVQMATIGRLMDDKEKLAESENWNDKFTLQQVERLRKLQRSYSELSEAIYKARKAAAKEATK